MKFNWKVFSGILLVILSFLIGKIAPMAFIANYSNKFIRYLSIAAYVVSWPMLFLGVYIAGADYVKRIYHYFTYKYYYIKAKETHEIIKKRFKKPGQTIKKQIRDR